MYFHVQIWNVFFKNVISFWSVDFSAEEHVIHQTHFFSGIKNVFSVNCVWLCMVKHSSFWCARLSIIYIYIYIFLTCKKKNCCVIFYTFIDMNWPCLSSICIFLLINLSFEYALTSILANQDKVWRNAFNTFWVDVQNWLNFINCYLSYLHQTLGILMDLKDLDAESRTWISDA